MEKKKNQTKARTRNYATVVYPDSAPNDWKEILENHFVPTFISPLHDKDKNPTGEDKKPHYHVLIMFDGVKTHEQAKEIFQSFGGVGCERVNSIRGYARYLCHLDNPEKARYNISDVISLCGADYHSVTSLPSDRHSALKDMMYYIRENNIEYFSDFVLFCAENREDWFITIIDSGAYVIKEFIKTESFRRK